MKTRFALVVLLRPLSKQLCYIVPEPLVPRIQVGSRVLVPLGKNRVTGFVVAFADRPQVSSLREIIDVLDPYPVFDRRMLDLTEWIAEYYQCSWGEVLKAALPSGINLESRSEVFLKTPDFRRVSSKLKGPKQMAVIRLLAEKGSRSLVQLTRDLGEDNLYASVHDLEEKGYVEVRRRIKPPMVSIKRERVVKLLSQKSDGVATEIERLRKRAPRQAQVLQLLAQNGGKMSASRLRGEWGISDTTVDGLREKGLIEISLEEVIRDPYASREFEPPERFVLTDAQADALGNIEVAINSGSFRTILLYGVTGSGKTEVYIRGISAALAAGKGAIVLVPEISLTPQTVRRFKAHFGQEVAVLHSRLSLGERYDAWRRVREAKQRIVVGARSAVFAPVANLGLIVIDEEHDPSYKQHDANPRYNARDVAIMRAKLEGAVAVLGSATPSLESYENALTDKFIMCRLPKRIDNRPMPGITVVDMRNERAQGNTGILSRLLHNKLEQRLRKGEQVILLQNRRGYSTFIQCCDCGYVPRCKNCKVSLTFHRTDRRLICHYCGYQKEAPSLCPVCRGYDMRYGGIGTERVERVLKSTFPQARLIRMDLDTTKKKGSHELLLESFRRGEANVLLGTQMVAKGLDFPGVTLVGVISADTGLNLPDFRAGERTLQLLIQVAGRTGRGDQPGEVVIQTYSPGDLALRYLKTHNFDGFLYEELADRRQVNYPPFSRLITLLFQGEDEERVSSFAEEYAAFLRQIGPDAVQILGPAEAPLGRLRGNFRWQLLLKGRSSKVMRHLVAEATGTVGKRRGVRVIIDVDPMEMM